MRRLITITSTLKEISTYQLGLRSFLRRKRYSAGPHPFLQQASEQISKDDVDGFFLHHGYLLHRYTESSCHPIESCPSRVESHEENFLPPSVNKLVLASFLLEDSALNDLFRTMLSCGRMIRLLAHPRPPAPSPVSNLSLFLSLPVCRRLSLLMREGGGGRGWARS